ncbi:MAG: tRNA dihydrouridine(20/20a) synthase DusA [Rhodospirillaceae bacterium]|nr:MAG: tRNA dihydrouridine(20/20a) synthase DusA [Rhodospirillaceae bacterium]
MSRDPTHRFAVAPMMDYTDQHCRMLFRLISRHTRLYTEMVTAAAIVHGQDPQRFLAFDPTEEPLTLQLGGSDPALLATAARTAKTAGFQNLNLNVGCPSDKVTVGRFGACLMAEPAVVANAVRAMADATGLPVTVKNRLGIDDQDTQRDLDRFIEIVSAAGCDTFIIHARKAWLKGLSPKENREIPPLDYDRVHALKRAFPDLTIVLNGGLTSLDAACAVLEPSGNNLDGVMIGRAAIDSPYILAEVDARLFGDTAAGPDRPTVVARYLAYAAAVIEQGARRPMVVRPLVGLFKGCPGARAWRQAVTRVAQGESRLADLEPTAVRLASTEAIAA